MESGMDALIRKLYFYARYLYSEDIQTVIGCILKDMGFKARSRGFLFLRTAIQMYYEDPSQLMVHGIYLEVARRTANCTSRYQVEAAVRRSIRQAWDSRDPEVWDIFFSEGVNTGKHGPTNLDFISEMASVLEIWEGCCKEMRKGGTEVGEHEKAK